MAEHDNYDVPPRPDTYDPWFFLEFCIEHRHKLFIQRTRPEFDPVTGESPPVTKFVSLGLLPVGEFTYWVKRWFMDRSAPVRTQLQWRSMLPGPRDSPF